MPMYDFKCQKCELEFETLAKSTQKTLPCPCGSKAKRRPAAVGGYHIRGNNSASVRPKQAGSFKKR